MNNLPKVCICIPCYNNEETLAQTLDSLILQTYTNTIIKIIDNASEDSSFKIAQEYEKNNANISVYQNHTNIGGEANFTKCIKELEGEYGAIFHADDIYLPTMVEMQVNYLIKENLSAIFVRANLIDGNSNNIGEQFFPEELTKKHYYQFNFEQLFSLVLKYDNFLITPSVMADVGIYKRKIKAWNGKKFKTSADLDVWLRFSEIKNIGIITKKLISYRVSEASYSYRLKFSRIIPRDMFLVLEFYLQKYKKLKFDRSDYEFLQFKDNIIVISNKILNKQDLGHSHINIFNLGLLSKVFFDAQKFKIFSYAIMLKILIFLQSKSGLFYLVIKANKIPNEVNND